MLEYIPNWNIVGCGMWRISITSGWEHDQRLHTMKQEEIAAIMCNIKRFLALLGVSKSSKDVEALYLHREVSRIVAVDAAGFDGIDARAYTFPQDETRTLYLLCLGKADPKHADIEYCKSLVYYIVNTPDTSTVE